MARSTHPQPRTGPRERPILLKSHRAARLPHLLQPRGEAALARAMARSPLLAFDFDGTLAPIVARPDQARASASVAGKLRRLAEQLPVAVVSGRSSADLQRRLGFEPHYIVGNHGADIAADGSGRPAAQLDPVRAELHARSAELQAAGVVVEDKGLSLALHYRYSLQPDRALGLIRQTLAGVAAPCRTFPGKMVENVVPADTPDKGDAVHRIAEHAGAPCAVFFGDDVNDEPVFEKAPPDWLTVRIGREDRNSRAGFFLDHPAELGLVLDRMLAYLQDPGHAPAILPRH